MGRQADLERLTLRRCKGEHARRYLGGEAILTLAGNIDFDAVSRASRKYSAISTAASPRRGASPLPPPAFHFLAQASEQTHIGLAYPSIPPTHPDYYTMRVAMEVLGGGTSARLFTELREKRGLVYSVWAGYSAMKDLGAILGYAGTSNERAQATLDCLLGEVHRLAKGVDAAEVARARTGLKANMIMESESTASRSGSLAHDYFTFGRARSLEEIKTAIDRVTVDGVNAFLKALPPPI
jgi:predicted Zn-dependent peptidase